MISDARTVPADKMLQADICIVGAGAAGISLALSFAASRTTVLLLESGGLQTAGASQMLSEGTSVGLPYHSLERCRPRCLGGTTSLWGGWCHPLETIDFESQNWLPHSGWPFARGNLETAYASARVLCGLSQPGLQSRFGFFPPSDRPFQDSEFEIGAVRFGEVYRDDLKASANIQVLLNASAVELVSFPESNAITLLRVCAEPQKSFSVSAICFVLAAGGIENARILLASRSAQPRGLGNQNDLVGRFFADHLHLQIGTISRDVPFTQFYETKMNGRKGRRGLIAIGQKFRRNEKLLGFAATFHNAADPHDVVRPAFHSGYQSLLDLVRTPFQQVNLEALRRHGQNLLADPKGLRDMIGAKLKNPPRSQLLVGCRAEQAPNPQSRVILSRATDRFGMPQVQLDWQITHLDRQSLSRARNLLESEFYRLRIPFHPHSDANSLAGVPAGAHHMGTTRMHQDPKKGVVDAECRVHGVDNLYIAGCSVFPTSGWVPPTLTAIALSLRLGDTLKTRLSAPLT